MTRGDHAIHKIGSAFDGLGPAPARAACRCFSLVLEPQVRSAPSRQQKVRADVSGWILPRSQVARGSPTCPGR
jgi:hypothetical protein